MTESQLEFFKNLLLEEKKELLAEIVESDESARTLIENDLNSVNDAVDTATSKITQDMLSILSEKNKSTLLQIDSALRRIEEKTFGICVTCQEDIMEERLKALPWATQCMNCKSKAQSKNNNSKKTV